ncbi:DUF3726 domain-containing protein [Rhodovulum sp. YNF3179]|uniref:DUF3726 domain-containing protein n=1 Tax=Rhodovulum sp. YNF3179 TaxID=3425127 RepID=UPI003D330E27
MKLLSLGETEALVRKAARGAGRSWGMAEEAGRTARWLEAYGLPGAMLSAALLEKTDGAAAAPLAPQPDAAGVWRPGGAVLCPLAAGTALSDAARALPEDLRLGPVLCPLLILPHLAAAALQTGRSHALCWGDTRLTLTALGALLPPEGAWPDQDRVACVTCRRDVRADAAPLARRHRAAAAQDTIRRLERLAERTYAPETADRRLSGAGAGLTDND